MSRRRAPGRRPPTDAGFTLIELVMAVSILGIIAVALTGVVLSYLRHTVDTEARLTESHDVQFAAAYWQRDVSSIGVRSATYDEPSHSFPLVASVGLARCADTPADATPVVTLGWSEYSSLDSSAPPTKVKVTYATRAVGDAYELLRIRCGSQPSTVQVADTLLAAPTVACRDSSGATTACDGAGSAVPARVELRLEVHDSSGRGLPTYTATLAGERRQT